MKRLIITLSGMLAFAAAAHAAEPAAGQNDPPAPQTQAQAGATTVDPGAKAAVNERTCLRHTGTHIRAPRDGKRDACTARNGRAYTRDDLDRTGETNIADALRRLDPSIH